MYLRLPRELGNPHTTFTSCDGIEESSLQPNGINSSAKRTNGCQHLGQPLKINCTRIHSFATDLIIVFLLFVKVPGYDSS